MEDNLNKNIVEDAAPISASPFIYSALPLIIYPGILMAGIMSLGGSTGNAPILLILIVKSFLWTSLLYPVTYIFCLVSFFITKNETVKRLLLKIPHFHLALCAVLLVLWIIPSIITDLK